MGGVVPRTTPKVARAFAGVGVGFDVVAYTQSELAAAAHAKERFVAMLLAEGLVVARRDAGPEDFMRLAGSVVGQRDLSARKGFSGS